MDTNRFKRRTDYNAPVRRPAPVRDELGELRQPAPTTPTPAAAPTPTPTPTPVPTPIVVADAPVEAARVPVAPRPVHESASMPPEAAIDLSKPDTGGWLDAINPEDSQPTLVASTDVTAAEALPAPTISVQISLPSNISLPKPRLPAWPYRKIAIRAGIATAVVAVLLTGTLVSMHFLRHSSQPKLTQAQKLATNLAQPTFAPVAPKDKAGLAAGEAGKTTFDGSRNTYSYQDTLGNVPLIVSQQPIPAKFNTSQEAVSSAAQSLGAKTTFATHYGKVYMFTSTKSNAQMLVLSVNSLLVFIQSSFTHSTADYTTYINNLK